MLGYIELGIDREKELFQYLTVKFKSKDVIRNAMLREIRDNIKLLEHRNKEGVNLKAIIESLSHTAIENAYANNFNLNKLNEKRLLSADFILNKRQEDYIGWDCKKFIYSIEGKIKDIKNLPRIYDDLKTAPVNLTLRLDNLFYQLVLFTLFIRGEKPIIKLLPMQSNAGELTEPA